MDVERRTLIGAGLGLGLIAASSAHAQSGGSTRPSDHDPDAPDWPTHEHFPLWPKSPPGAPAKLPAANLTMSGSAGDRHLWVRGVAMPEVSVFRPARPDGSAILAIPGGGYGFISVQKEGLDVAQKFTADRTTVFVLSYRLPGEGWHSRHLVPLQDAQRAMRLIRARASDFDIDPARLGILGFSAGGHLASDLATAYDRSVYERVDAADVLSAKPAFAGLIYPVATLEPPIAHAGSRNALLGPNQPAELIADRSPLLHVSGATPPCFLVHAFDDDVVPVANSLQWIAACEKAKVPVEAHLFAKGSHGFGLSLPKDLPGSNWPDLFALWMRRNGG